MDNRINNSTGIELSDAHRQLIDSLMVTITEGKKAEATLKLVVQGILQQGGAKGGIPYGRSNDGAMLIPTQVTLTAKQLEEMAVNQAENQNGCQ